MTIHEYRLRMKAYQLQRLDKSQDIHLQAWVNEQAKATKKNGKRYFSSFNSFFDFKAEETKILMSDDKRMAASPLMILIAKANKKGGI